MRMSKHWVAMLCCLAVLGGVIRAVEIKMGVPFPEDSGEWKAVAEAAKEIAKATNNKVLIVLTAPGKKEELARKILDGKLDGGLVIGKDFLDLKLDQDALTYAIPFTFKSTSQVDYVRQHLDAEILGKLSAGSYEALAFAEFGFAYMMSSNPLSTPENWQERKIWVPDQGSIFKCLGDLGLNTVPGLVKDVQKNLKSGAIDSIIVPPSGAILKSWHRRIKEVFDVPYVYTYGIWVVSDKALPELTAAERDAVRKHLDHILGKATRKRNFDARQVLIKWKLKFVVPAPGDNMYKQWEKWAVQIWDVLEDKNKPTTEVNKKLKKLISDFNKEEKKPAVQ